MTRSKDFDALIFIGRFQPLHHGHLHVIRTALQAAGEVCLLCGSHEAPRSVRNPWTVGERATMILEALPAADRGRVRVLPLADDLYDDERWVRRVREAVRAGGLDDGALRTGLIGHTKDTTSYYLKLFPHWGTLEVANHRGISATPIREQLLRDAHAHDVVVPTQGGDPIPLAEALPDNVRAFVREFAGSTHYPDLRSEQAAVDQHRGAWAGAPFPPIHITVDALVQHADRVLLVQRKHWPGKGLWALPGGFLDAGESLLAGCLRELREETQLALTDAELRAALRGQRVFDEPTRSVRGHTITHAFHFDLGADGDPPAIRAADDAQDAFWAPVAELASGRMFEDHYFIVRAMCGHTETD